MTDAGLERRSTPRFNDESVLNYVLASFWPPNISLTLLSPRYVGPDLLKQPPYVNCGAQMPPDEIRIMHLEKCHQVDPRCRLCHNQRKRQGSANSAPRALLCHATPTARRCSPASVPSLMLARGPEAMSTAILKRWQRTA